MDSLLCRFKKKSAYTPASPVRVVWLLFSNLFTFQNPKFAAAACAATYRARCWSAHATAHITSGDQPSLLLLPPSSTASRRRSKLLPATPPSPFPASFSSPLAAELPSVKVPSVSAPFVSLSAVAGAVQTEAERAKGKGAPPELGRARGGAPADVRAEGLLAGPDGGGQRGGATEAAHRAALRLSGGSGGPLSEGPALKRKPVAAAEMAEAVAKDTVSAAAAAQAEEAPVAEVAASAAAVAAAIAAGAAAAAATAARKRCHVEAASRGCHGASSRKKGWVAENAASPLRSWK